MSSPNHLFSSDYHLDHANIIKYCNRPFKDKNEMNELIIKNHNSVVKENDYFYFMGDFCFSSRIAEFISRLNGKKVFIIGNHDRKNMFKNIGIESISDVKMIEIANQKIFLSHYAHRIWPQAHHGVWHLYGHSHGGLEDQGKSTDVGVDNCNFIPISFEELREKFKYIENIKHH